MKTNPRENSEELKMIISGEGGVGEVRMTQQECALCVTFLHCLTVYTGGTITWKKMQLNFK